MRALQRRTDVFFSSFYRTNVPPVFVYQALYWMPTRLYEPSNPKMVRLRRGNVRAVGIPYCLCCLGFLWVRFHVSVFLLALIDSSDYIRWILSIIMQFCALARWSERQFEPVTQNKMQSQKTIPITRTLLGDHDSTVKRKNEFPIV